jgi:hypothetical protein
MAATRHLPGKGEIGQKLVEEQFLRPLTLWARWVEVLAPFPPQLKPRIIIPDDRADPIDTAADPEEHSFRRTKQQKRRAA